MKCTICFFKKAAEDKKMESLSKNQLLTLKLLIKGFDYAVDKNG